MSTDVPKIAIIGANGFIGRHFHAFFKAIHPDIIATTRRRDQHHLPHLDLRRPNIKDLKLKEKGHTHAIICAAESNVYRCETRPKTSNAINIVGTRIVMEQLVEEGVMPIFLSTDYVFDGVHGNFEVEAPRQPTTLYGKQKAEMEDYLLGFSNDQCLILRLSKVYSLTKGDGSILDEMGALLKSGNPVRAAHDQVFNPIYIGDVIKATTALVTKNVMGTIHLCGDKAIARLALAKGLATAMGADAKQVQEISLEDLDGKLKRPKNTSMSNASLRAHYSDEMMSIETYTKRVAENYS